MVYSWHNKQEEGDFTGYPCGGYDEKFRVIWELRPQVNVYVWVQIMFFFILILIQEFERDHGHSFLQGGTGAKTTN